MGINNDEPKWNYYLYKEMYKVIEHFNPKAFIFENVRGLLSARWTKNGVKGEIFKEGEREHEGLYEPLWINWNDVGKVFLQMKTKFVQSKVSLW